MLIYRAHAVTELENKSDQTYTYSTLRIQRETQRERKKERKKKKLKRIIAGIS